MTGTGWYIEFYINKRITQLIKLCLLKTRLRCCPICLISRLLRMLSRSAIYCPLENTEIIFILFVTEWFRWWSILLYLIKPNMNSFALMVPCTKLISTFTVCLVCVFCGHDSCWREAISIYWSQRCGSNKTNHVSYPHTLGIVRLDCSPCNRLVFWFVPHGLTVTWISVMRYSIYVAK